MIKISVDTTEELNIVRRVLRDEACSHSTCHNLEKRISTVCNDCINEYYTNRVKLYKREMVEMPEDVVV